MIRRFGQSVSIMRVKPASSPFLHPGPLRPEEDVLRHLLADRRAAAHPLGVGHRRPDARDVEPPVAAEVRVLRRRRRQRQVRPTSAQRHPLPLDPPEPQPLGDHQVPRRRVHPAEQHHQPHRRQRQAHGRPHQPAPEPPQEPPQLRRVRRMTIAATCKESPALASGETSPLPRPFGGGMEARPWRSRLSTFRPDWLVPAAIEEVAAILSEPERLPEWWPAVYLSVASSTPAPRTGSDDGRLPHPRLAPLHPALAGPRRRGPPPARAGPSRRPATSSGRGTWSLAQRGDLAAVDYDWRIDVEKPLLKPLTPLLRAVYAANHRWAMARGLEGLPAASSSAAAPPSELRPPGSPPRRRRGRPLCRAPAGIRA